MAKQPKTYRAPHPVYVDRQYHKANRTFTTAAEKGEGWEEVSVAEKAASDAQDPIPGDVPLESLNLSSLRALAAERHVDSTGLSKPDLIDAIKAANEPKL